MKAEEARKLDLEDKPYEASKAYEEAILEKDSDIGLYLDLAVLYFVCTDFGYASYHKLTREFTDYAWARANEVLDEAENKFGRDSEIAFWREYFRFYTLGDQYSKEKCEKIIRKTSSFVPFFYLYVYHDEEKYHNEVMKLYEMVRDGATARKRFIKSIIENKLKSVGLI